MKTADGCYGEKASLKVVNLLIIRMDIGFLCLINVLGFPGTGS